MSKLGSLAQFWKLYGAIIYHLSLIQDLNEEKLQTSLFFMDLNLKILIFKGRSWLTVLNLGVKVAMNPKFDLHISIIYIYIYIRLSYLDETLSTSTKSC